MALKKSFSTEDVKHIAELAQIPVTDTEIKSLASGFTKTLDVINKLNELSTDDVEPTHQVTGLHNIFREDTIDESRMFSQEEALLNAKNTHNGFYVVDQILDE